MEEVHEEARQKEVVEKVQEEARQNYASGRVRPRLPLAVPGHDQTRPAHGRPHLWPHTPMTAVVYEQTSPQLRLWSDLSAALPTHG